MNRSPNSPRQLSCALVFVLFVFAFRCCIPLYLSWEPLPAQPEDPLNRIVEPEVIDTLFHGDEHAMNHAVGDPRQDYYPVPGHPGENWVRQEVERNMYFLDGLPAFPYTVRIVKRYDGGEYINAIIFSADTYTIWVTEPAYRLMRTDKQLPAFRSFASVVLMHEVGHPFHNTYFKVWKDLPLSPRFDLPSLTHEQFEEVYSDWFAVEALVAQGKDPCDAVAVNLLIALKSGDSLKRKNDRKETHPSPSARILYLRYFIYVRYGITCMPDEHIQFH